MLSYKYLFITEQFDLFERFPIFYTKTFLYSLSKTTTPRFAMLDFLISDTLHYFYFYLTACESEIFNKDFFAFITIIKFKGTGSFIIFSHFSVLNNIRMNISVKKQFIFVVYFEIILRLYVCRQWGSSLFASRIKKNRIYFLKRLLSLFCAFVYSSWLETTLFDHIVIKLNQCVWFSFRKKCTSLMNIILIQDKLYIRYIARHTKNNSNNYHKNISIHCYIL